MKRTYLSIALLALLASGCSIRGEKISVASFKKYYDEKLAAKILPVDAVVVNRSLASTSYTRTNSIIEEDEIEYTLVDYDAHYYAVNTTAYETLTTKPATGNKLIIQNYVITGGKAKSKQNDSGLTETLDLNTKVYDIFELTYTVDNVNDKGKLEIKETHKNVETKLKSPMEETDKWNTTVEVETVISSDVLDTFEVDLVRKSESAYEDIPADKLAEIKNFIDTSFLGRASVIAQYEHCVTLFNTSVQTIGATLADNSVKKEIVLNKKYYVYRTYETTNGYREYQLLKETASLLRSGERKTLDAKTANEVSFSGF